MGSRSHSGVLTLIALIPIGLASLVSPAGATFGNPVLSRGEASLGITARRFTRDIYDIEAGKLSIPGDTFGYVGLESRLGLWRNRLDFGLEVGRSHNRQDRFPERDYFTWELGFTLRGLLYEEPDGRVDVTGGFHYQDTVAFDRAPTLTHKLQRNVAGFVLAGRRISAGGRPLRLYGGPLYSRHDIDEYGASYQVGDGPGEGETRSNLELLGGASMRIRTDLEATGEIEWRDNVSFGLSAGVVF